MLLSIENKCPARVGPQAGRDKGKDKFPMSSAILPQSNAPYFSHFTQPVGVPLCLQCQQPLTGEPVANWYCSEACHTAYESALLAKLPPMPATICLTIRERKARKAVAA